MNKKITFTITAIALAAALTSCSSVPKEIPESLTAQELIQLGQSNFESGNYKAALAYYNTTVERYADFPAIYVEAQYEIAHLYVKEKKYDLAVPVLNELKQMYDSTAPGTLPAAYKKLAEIEFEKIPADKKN
jgi:outer membrane protein assembly factor BamD (BamD/ComL family)